MKLTARGASLLQRAAGVRAWHWLLLSAVILVLDYLTGPVIQFPILFIVPVALATASHGASMGGMLAVLLPMFRLAFFLEWGRSDGRLVEVADAAIDVLILAAFALLLDRLIRQQREIQILQGLLPICSFCKRIREEGGEWRQFETYIAERSDARFSHTFCPECGRTHYPGMVD